MNRPRFLITATVLLVIACVAPAVLFSFAKSIPPEKSAKNPPVIGKLDDAALIRALLAQDLPGRSFAFSDVVAAVAGKRVNPLGTSAVHAAAASAIMTALDAACAESSFPAAPVQSARRINDASRFFEDSLREKLNAVPGFRCEIPLARTGKRQRAGYPDLQITHLPTGAVFYLDPKLISRGSETGTLRTFYFEPKKTTLKIHHDAVHLIASIIHEGTPNHWKFSSGKLVDLSALRVRLKAEFQANNADIY